MMVAPSTSLTWPAAKTNRRFGCARRCGLTSRSEGRGFEGLEFGGVLYEEEKEALTTLQFLEGNTPTSAHAAVSSSTSIP